MSLNKFLDVLNRFLRKTCFTKSYRDLQFWELEFLFQCFQISLVSCVILLGPSNFSQFFDFLLEFPFQLYCFSGKLLVLLISNNENRYPLVKHGDIVHNAVKDLCTLNKFRSVLAVNHVDYAFWFVQLFVQLNPERIVACDVYNVDLLILTNSCQNF